MRRLYSCMNRKEVPLRKLLLGLTLTTAAVLSTASGASATPVHGAPVLTDGARVQTVQYWGGDWRYREHRRHEYERWRHHEEWRRHHDYR